MNKLIVYFIASVTCISTVHADTQAFKLTALPENSAPFKLNAAAADDEDGIKGKFFITADFGVGGLGNSLLLKYSGSSIFFGSNVDNYGVLPEIDNIKQAPSLSVGLDFGVLEKVTVGVSFAYQKVELMAYDTFFDKNQYDSNGNYISSGSSGPYDITDTWIRYNMAIRGDYHIVANKFVALYTGIKLGYNTFKVSSTYSSIDPTYLTTLNSRVSPSSISAQAHLGFSVFIGGIVGFNVEVGLAYGGPYNLAAGLAVKI